MAAAAFALAAPAWAQRADRPLLQRPGAERQWSPQQEGADRSRPAEGARPDLRGEGGGRMSREERLQLRRDIDDAGRELYRRPLPRRRF